MIPFAADTAAETSNAAFFLIHRLLRKKHCTCWMLSTIVSKITRQSEMANFANVHNKAAYHVTQSNHLLPAVGESKSLRQGVMGCSLMNTAKPEVHNVLQFHQRRNELWPQATCTEHFITFGCVVFETDTQTDRHADSNTSHSYDITINGVNYRHLNS